MVGGSKSDAVGGGRSSLKAAETLWLKVAEAPWRRRKLLEGGGSPVIGGVRDETEGWTQHRSTAAG
jgi:hypothetical protein